MKDTYYNQIKWHIVSLVHQYNEMIADYDTTYNELSNIEDEIEITVKDYNADSKLTHQHDMQFPYCEIRTDTKGRKHYHFEWNTTKVVKTYVNSSNTSHIRRNIPPYGRIFQ